jgi:predicted signal transduction protein with EAL and GGDEF domain
MRPSLNNRFSVASGIRRPPWLRSKRRTRPCPTGHATLTYLKSFRADEIKMDKSSVTHLPETTSDQILVRSTIELAHELRF